MFRKVKKDESIIGIGIGKIFATTDDTDKMRMTRMGKVIITYYLLPITYYPINCPQITQTAQIKQ